MATTATPAAREFITDINAANEEVVRLDTQLKDFETTKTALTKAQADLSASNQLLSEAPKAADLQAAKDAQKLAEDALTKAKAEHATAVSELQAKVDKEKGNTLNAAAAAGVETPVGDGKSTGIDKVDENRTKAAGKTGLERAIAANVALQASSAK
jgi:hypothetical protein